MSDGTSSPCVCVVPARLASVRLPHKVLADIGGQANVRHVLERRGQAKGIAAEILCADDDGLATDAVRWNFLFMHSWLLEIFSLWTPKRI